MRGFEQALDSYKYKSQKQNVLRHAQDIGALFDNQNNNKVLLFVIKLSSISMHQESQFLFIPSIK